MSGTPESNHAHPELFPTGVDCGASKFHDWKATLRSIGTLVLIDGVLIRIRVLIDLSIGRPCLTFCGRVAGLIGRYCEKCVCAGDLHVCWFDW